MRFVSCAGQRDVQVTLGGCPRASQATLSSSLRSCVTSSFPPALPQTLQSPLSRIPLIWPLRPRFWSISSRSWTNQQICQETQEGNRGLSACAGYLGARSQETVSVRVQVIPGWRQVEAGPLRSSGPAVLWIRVKDEKAENSARVVPEPERGACDWETWKESYFLLVYLGTSK